MPEVPETPASPQAPLQSPFLAPPDVPDPKPALPADSRDNPDPTPKRHLRLGPLLWTGLGLSLLAGVLAGLSVWVLSQPWSSEPMPLRLLGQELPPPAHPEAARSLVTARLEAALDAPFKLNLSNGLPPGATETETAQITRLRELGVTVDQERVEGWFAKAAHPTAGPFPGLSVTPRGGRLDIPAAFNFNVMTAASALYAIKDALDQAPRDARVLFEQETPDGSASTPRVEPEQHGRRLDVGASLADLRRAVLAGRQELLLTFKEQRAERGRDAFSNATFDAVLGEFTTRYDRSARSRARTFNLARAAARLDGTVLLPGEEFDFNRRVGPRDEASGYQVAPVIAQGELVDGIGGGTCQISGTLHAAAYFAGLDVVERHPHTRPSSYIKLGLDAAVAYPALNLRLRNPYAFPVALRQYVQDGEVRAEIRGAERPRTVTLIRKISRAIPYKEVTRNEPGLKKGQRRLTQRGVAGFHVQRYRIVRDGPHAVRQVTRDVYPPTPQIISVGTGDTTTLTPPRSPYPEYTADELLVMTLEKGGTFSESRSRGRFGSRGWTEKAGMPVWRGP